MCVHMFMCTCVFVPSTWGCAKAYMHDIMMRAHVVWIPMIALAVVILYVKLRRCVSRVMSSYVYMLLCHVMSTAC
jgi:hypothetical protein